jgi:hypothetical protein
MNYAQGVFAYNYKPSEFVRMFTLKNSQSISGANAVRYFGNSVPVDGTSLYVDGGPFKEPKMLVSKINKNDTFYVTMKYKKPVEQTQEVEVTSDSYVLTTGKYDAVALGATMHTKVNEDNSDKDVKIIYIEDLLADESIITKLTPAKINNVGFLVRDPKKLSTIGGTATEYFYNQRSSLKRPYYLQLGTSGLTHTYGGSHPFKKFNLYIKSWMGSRSYLIEQQIKVQETSYVRTPKSYNFGSNPALVEQQAVTDTQSAGYKGRMITLEELIANKNLIKELGADFFNSVQIKINLPSKLQNYNSSYNSYSVGSRLWYLQKNTNGARWAYNGEHPFREFNLYIKSWHGMRSTIIVKEPTGVATDPDGEFEISLTNLTASQRTTLSKKETSHDFHIDWNKIDKLSVGGGSNCTIADFRLYNRILNDSDVNSILDIKNPDFNTSGPSFP